MAAKLQHLLSFIQTSAWEKKSMFEYRNMWCHTSVINTQNAGKKKKKRWCVSQSARLDGVLNTARHCDTHTQVSGPYNCLKNKQKTKTNKKKKPSVGVESAEWSGGVKQGVKALGPKSSGFLAKMKEINTWVQKYVFSPLGESRWTPPIILSSASFQTATVSCWMGNHVLHSVTVLQQMYSGCVCESPPSDMALSFA